MRRLIVSADDLGLCRGTVGGIAHGHRRGIITSAGLMVTMPGLPSALEVIRACPNLDIGVHLCFTEGRPVLPPDRVPSLLDEEGRFHVAQWWQSAPPQLVLSELREELEAQVAMARRLGARPTHLDLHTHAGYLVAEIFEMTVAIARGHGLAMRLPFGEEWEPMGIAIAEGLGVPPARVQEMAASYCRSVELARVPHPDRFIDAFTDRASCSGRALARRLRSIAEGTTEILTHPGFRRACWGDPGIGAGKRAAELAALCDPRVRRAIEEEGIELAGFGSPA
jgi:predicted glycoside hydrolase/deacetylase ChbG (UPF0249 family)